MAVLKLLSGAMRACAIAACFFTVMSVSHGHAAGPQHCADVSIPVSIAAGGQKKYKIYGRLCHPASGPSDVLQILVHGYTYDHRYWATPEFGDEFNYVKAANSAGFSTLAIDRLGSAGDSSRPASALVTLEAGAISLHDVVSAARGGGVPDGPYDTILMVGHSLGAAIAWIEASLYQDVDGLISTGFGHPVGAIGDVLLSTTPAFFDSRLRPLVGLDLNYLTTTPGTRDDLFYRPETSDPDMIAYDEATKGLGTLSELLTLTHAEASSLAITAPVLTVMGEHDHLFCLGESIGGLVNCASDETLYISERVYFPLAADFEAYVLQGAGHNINLHDGAEDWFQKANDWAGARFPPNQ